MVLMPLSVFGQLTWGTNGNGGTGTWNSSNLDWYNGSSNIAWASGDTATFAGTGGTVTIAGTQIASQLTFNASGTYTLAGTQLTGTSSGLTIETDSNAEIDAQINSTTNVTKTGAGTLTLGGNVVQSSAFTIQAGTLEIGIGPINGFGVETQLNGSTIVNNGLILFNANGLGIIGDQVSGTGSVHLATVQGAGLSNSSNTYTGSTTIDTGELSVATVANGGVTSSIGASSNAAANLIFGNGAIEFSGSTDRLFTIGDAAGNSAWIGSDGASDFTNTGAIAFGTTGVHNLVLGSVDTGSTGVFAPSIGDQSPGNPTNLGKSNVGTWTLTGNNTYTGSTSINGGVLSLGSNGALGNTSDILFGSGSLQFSAANTTDYSSVIANSTGAISIDTNGQNVTFASGLGSTNTGGLAQVGMGTLTLTGHNVYTGTTKVTAGTLSLGGTGSLAASSVTSSGTGIFTEASGASISGTGITFTQGSSGTSTLAGVNTYTGTTSVTAGTLILSATGSLAGSNVSTSGTGVLSEVSGGSISGTGTTFTQGSSGTSTLAGANTYTGTTSVTSGTLDIGATGSLAGSNVSISSQGYFSESSGGSITGAGVTFTQGGNGTATLYGTNTYTGATLVTLDGLEIGATGSLAGSNVSTSGPGYFDEDVGGSITGAGTTFTQGSGSPSFLLGTNTYTGATLVTNGLLSIGLTGSLAGSSVSTSGTGTFFEGNGATITGVGVAFTQGSSSTSTLGGTNSYTGLTRIDGGVLNVANLANGGSNSSIGASSNAASNLIFGGGTLQYNANTTAQSTDRLFTIGDSAGNSATIDSSSTIAGNTFSFTNTGAIALVNTAGNPVHSLILTGSNTGANTFALALTNLAGDTSGSTLTKNGMGTWILTSASTYTGATSVTAGALIIGATGSLAGSNVSTSGTGIVSEIGGGSITGAGTAFTQGSSGTSTLAGTNTYTGLTSINGGILNLGSSGALDGGGNITFGGGTLQYSSANANDYSGVIISSTGAISIDTNGQNVAFASALAGSNTGGLTKLGLGALTLAGADAYTGPTTVSAGTLNLNGTLGNTSVTVNGGALALNVAGAISQNTLTLTSGTLTESTANAITGTAAVTYSVGMNLTVVNNYTGVTRINGGTLGLGNAAVFSGGGNITFGGGTLQYSAANTNDYSASIVNSTGVIAIDTNGQNVTYASALVGSNTGGLTKLGSGTLTLSAANNYTGVTRINGGILSLSNAGALNGGGNMSFGGGTLQYSAANTSDFSSKIINSTSAMSIDTNGQTVTCATGLGASNVGGLTKLGAGTLILNGSNNYSGVTTISAGTLQVGFSTLGSDLGPGSVADNGQLIFSASNQGVGNLISGSGTVFVAPSTAVDLSNASNTYSGSTTVDGSLFVATLTNGGSASSIGSSSNAAANLIFGNGTLEYTGSTAQTTNRLFTIGQAIASGATINASGSGSGTLSFTNTGAIALVASITHTLTLTGSNTGANTFAPSLSDQSVGKASSLVKAGAGTWDLTNSASSYTGSTSVNGGILNVATLGNGGSNSSIGASSSAAANLLFGGGTLQYTGSTAQSTDRLFTIGDTNGNAATLDSSSASAGNTVSFTNTGSLVLVNTASNPVHSLTLTGSNTGNNIFAPVFSNLAGDTSGSMLTKTGTGTWIITGNNTYTGGTTVSAGILQFGNGGTTGSASNSTIIDNASLVFDRSNTLIISGSGISGTGSITQMGSGTLQLGGGQDTYTGTTTVAAGTLLIPSSPNLYGGNTASWTATNIVVQSGATLALDVNNVVIGLGVEFTPAQVGTLLALGTSTGGFENGSIAGIDNSGSINYTSVIANPNGGANVLGLTKLGAGTLTLSAANTYTGGTTVNGGTLQFTGSGTLGSTSGALTVNTGGTLDLDGTNQTVGNFTGTGGAVLNNGTATNKTFTIGQGNGTGGNFAGAVNDHSSGTGTLALDKVGSGTLTLSGVNSYSGGTTISAGTLQLSGSGTLGNTSGSLTVNTSGSLDLDGTSQTIGNFTGTGGTVLNNATGTSVTFTIGSGNGTGGSFAGAIEDHATGTGTLALDKIGTGTLTLAGSNTFTGLTSLSGGVLNLGSSGALGGGGNITFSGGTLQYSSANTDDYSGKIVSSTGAISVDTNGQTVTYASGLANSNTGGLTKLGLGTLTLTGSNAYSGGTLIAAGTLQIGNGGTSGTIGGGAIINEGTLAFDLSSAYNVINNMSGNGVIVNIGTGALTFGGTNTFSSGVTVSHGAVAFNGTTNGNVTVNSGASLTGNGTINGTLGGGGAVSPGDAPGVLTATATNPTGGLTYNFDLLQAGAPTWGDASDSGDAVLHLEGATPFTAPLTSSNDINIYLSGTGLLFDGGFFVNGATDELTGNIADATFTYYLLDNAHGTVSYDGNLYDRYAGLVTERTVEITGANFGDGTVNGYTEQFDVPSAPEPSTWALLLGCLTALAYWHERGRGMFRTEFLRRAVGRGRKSFGRD